MTSNDSSGDTWDPSKQPPEFFFDRGLGKRVAEGLRTRGWIIHTITDFYANDAQEIADDKWVSEARNRGWCGLTKDQKLWRLLDEKQWIPIFVLVDGHLGADGMVARFEASKAQIWMHAAAGDVGLWMVYEAGKPIHRRYPR